MNQKKVWDSIADQWNDFRQLRFRPVYDFLERYKPKKASRLRAQ